MQKIQKIIVMSAKKECGYFKDSEGEECYQFNNRELMQFVASVIIYIADSYFRETINEKMKELAHEVTSGV